MSRSETQRDFDVRKNVVSQSNLIFVVGWNTFKLNDRSELTKDGCPKKKWKLINDFGVRKFTLKDQKVFILDNIILRKNKIWKSNYLLFCRNYLWIFVLQFRKETVIDMSIFCGLYPILIMKNREWFSIIGLLRYIVYIILFCIYVNRFRNIKIWQCVFLFRKLELWFFRWSVFMYH